MLVCVNGRERRGPRLANDPDRYIRRVKAGRWQARPHVPIREGGEGRVNLGCFATAAEARQAVLDFWWGRRKPRLKWARPVQRGDVTVWIAVVRLPHWLCRVEVAGKGGAKRITRRPGPSVRLPGDYDTPEGAHAAAKEWLTRTLGLIGWYLTVAPAADLRTWGAA